MSTAATAGPPPVRRALWQWFTSVALCLLMLVGLGWLFLNRGQPEWIQLLVGLSAIATGCAAVVVFEWHMRAGPARQALAAGAVLAIVTLVISIISLEPADPTVSIPVTGGPSDGSDTPVDEPTPTPTSSPSPSPASKPALVVEQVGWPMLPDCDGGTQVAAMKGQPEAADYNGDSHGADVRAQIMKAGGASWEHGFVTLSLTARKGKKTSVMGFDVVTFTHSKAKASWVWAPFGGGCGESQAKRYGVNFDAAHPSVFAIPGPDERGNRKFGDPFTVSDNEAVPVEIWTANCKNYIEWGLRINYIVSGEEGIKTLDVNNSDHPYRSVGGQPPAYANMGDAYTNKMTRNPGSDAPCDPQVNKWEHD